MAEQADLIRDMYAIPERSSDRKINELVKRVRALKVHLLIFQHLKRKMPRFIFKRHAQQKLLGNIEHHFETVRTIMTRIN